MTPILPPLPEGFETCGFTTLVLTEYAYEAIELNRPKVPEGLVSLLESSETITEQVGKSFVFEGYFKVHTRVMARVIDFLKSLDDDGARL